MGFEHGHIASERKETKDELQARLCLPRLASQRHERGDCHDASMQSAPGYTHDCLGPLGFSAEPESLLFDDVCDVDPSPEHHQAWEGNRPRVHNLWWVVGLVKRISRQCLKATATHWHHWLIFQAPEMSNVIAGPQGPSGLSVWFHKSPR